MAPSQVPQTGRRWVLVRVDNAIDAHNETPILEGVFDNPEEAETALTEKGAVAGLADRFSLGFACQGRASDPPQPPSRPHASLQVLKQARLNTVLLRKAVR